MQWVSGVLLLPFLLGFTVREPETDLAGQRLGSVLGVNELVECRAYWEDACGEPLPGSDPRRRDLPHPPSGGQRCSF